MASLQNHAKTRILFNGTLMKRLSTITITSTSGKVVVHTLDGSETFAGFAPGEALKEVEVEGYIPVGGEEFNFESFNDSDEFLTCQYFIAGKTYAGLGQITAYRLTDSTNQASTYTATWTGEAKAAA